MSHFDSLVASLRKECKKLEQANTVQSIETHLNALVEWGAEIASEKAFLTMLLSKESEKEYEYKVEIIYLKTGTTTRPSQHGGGNSEEAIRVTHLKSGIMAQSGAGRSQHKNRRIALDMINAVLPSLGYEIIKD
jgi:hypothetical protein